MAEEKEGLNQEDIDNINKDIDDAQKDLVSKETEKQMEDVKAQAKSDAEKEFLVNQEIKDLKEANEKLKEENLNKEKESSEKIAALANKVNTYVESKQVISKENPLNSMNNIDELNDKDIDKIELESYEAFVKQRTKAE